MPGPSSVAVPPISRPVPDEATRTGTRVAPLLVAVLTAAVAIWAIEPWPVGVFQDDGLYTILGKSLARGDGFRYLNLPGAPSATHYPPGYPLLLAILWRLFPAFPANTAVFVFVNVAFLSVTAVGAWYFGHRRLGLGSNAAAIAALATVACVPALTFGVFVLSEPMFMALLLPVLLVGERAVDRGTMRDAAIAGLLAGLLALVRTLGAIVAPALVLVLALRRRWAAAAAAFAGAAVSIAPWQAWVGQHAGDVPPLLAGKYGSYGGWLSSAVSAEGPAFVVQVVMKNLGVLRANLWEMLGGGTDTPAPVIVLVATVAAFAVLALLGIGAREVARRAPVTVAFAAMYLGIVLAWPFEPTRFVWVLLPIIGVVAAVGARTIVRWRPASFPGQAARIAAMGAMLLLAAGYATYNARGFVGRIWTIGPQSFVQRASPLVDFALRGTGPDDLLATDDDALVHLYSGRRTIPVGTFTPQEYLVAQSYDFATEQLEDLLREFQPRFVLCGSAHCAIAANNLLQRQPAILRLVTPLERGVVFERLEPSPAPVVRP
jgi:hypothetical protein